MRKKMTALWLVLICIGNGQAQTTNEWLRQKKTQLKYLVQQIAALQMYGSSLKKGYSIANSGLEAIGLQKDKEANLHKSFFTSLLSPNPNLGISGALPEAKTIVATIQKLSAYFQGSIATNPLVNSDERLYVSSVFSSLQQMCDEQISQLKILTDRNTLQLTDDERFERTRTIIEDLRDKESFAKSFLNRTKILIAQRSQDLKEASSVKSIFNLK